MSSPSNAVTLTKHAFVALAKSELSLRRHRLAKFGSGWTSDIWWDLMLLLYISEGNDNGDVFALAGHAGLSIEFAERWLCLLVENQLVRSISSHRVAQQVVYELTKAGREKLESCLKALAR